MENKPFFTKYIAVEGEIKLGDHYFNHKTGHVTKRTDGSMDKAYIGFSKTKLFLCSRDIQIGDKVYCPQYNYSSEVTEIINNSDRDIVLKEMPHSGTFDKSQLIKVIGEISPEATWVKEGDEFDERDLSCIEKERGGSEDFYIGIKGPCGHFH